VLHGEFLNLFKIKVDAGLKLILINDCTYDPARANHVR